MGAGAKAYAAGIATAPQEPPPRTLLVGEREHRLYVLTPENVEYIAAQGNYVKLHASGADYISRDSVKRLAISLADRGFLRIERSLIVNVRAIAYAQRAGQGTYIFTLHSGTSLRSGARYRGAILQVIPLLQPTR
jgi:two-component system LytT family response regulator